MDAKKIIQKAHQQFYSEIGYRNRIIFTLLTDKPTEVNTGVDPSVQRSHISRSFLVSTGATFNTRLAIKAVPIVLFREIIICQEEVFVRIQIDHNGQTGQIQRWITILEDTGMDMPSTPELRLGTDVSGIRHGRTRRIDKRIAIILIQNRKKYPGKLAPARMLNFAVWDIFPKHMHPDETLRPENDPSNIIDEEHIPDGMRSINGNRRAIINQEDITPDFVLAQFQKLIWLNEHPVEIYVFPIDEGPSTVVVTHIPETSFAPNIWESYIAEDAVPPGSRTRAATPHPDDYTPMRDCKQEALVLLKLIIEPGLYIQFWAWLYITTHPLDRRTLILGENFHGFTKMELINCHILDDYDRDMIYELNLLYIRRTEYTYLEEETNTEMYCNIERGTTV